MYKPTSPSSIFFVNGGGGRKPPDIIVLAMKAPELKACEIGYVEYILKKDFWFSESVHNASILLYVTDPLC